MTTALDRERASVLDTRLTALIEQEQRAGEMPLALRRFAAEFGVGRPTVAMRLAADHLLALYGEIPSGSELPIEVARLCELCRVHLVGARPAPRKAAVYSAGEYKPRNGHTGKMYFIGLAPHIKIPEGIDHATARVSVAHELGHFMIHKRGNRSDQATLRLPSGLEEEALAEYGARLLLMPERLWPSQAWEGNLAEFALSYASLTRVTLHSVVTRMGDPDIDGACIRGAILWRINEQIPPHYPASARLTPQWHLCPGAFVPVRRCKARAQSLIGKLAQETNAIADSTTEDVQIGSFRGVYRVDAFAWGSLSEGTRLVLSIFREPKI